MKVESGEQNYTQPLKKSGGGGGECVKPRNIGLPKTIRTCVVGIMQLFVGEDNTKAPGNK